ncbi:MAG: hypothetical protein M0Q96_02560, partial [Candidatus Omnitrophica bacterium]|nr:hypothetical protein [Candidatus Omnitrophota bacterium]
MKTEVKKIDSTKRELNVEISGELVKNKFDEIFAHFAKEAKVPGFRPGKAPRDMLEKHYSNSIHEQVLKELVPEVYGQAVQKEALDVIELPQISEVKLDHNNLSFKALVEVSPEFEVKNYKKQKVNYKKIVVSDDEVKRHLDSLKESRKVEEIDDNFAKSLGYANIEEFTKAVERQIAINKDNQQRQSIEHQLIESVSKGLDFKLPESLVNRQAQDLLRQTKIDLAMKGLPREKIEEEEKNILAEIQPQ